MQDIDYGQLDLKANPGAFSVFDAEVLVPEILKLNSGDTYVEIGVDKGKSLSIVNMTAKQGVLIYGVDINKTPEIEKYLEENKHITYLWGDSVAIAKRWTLDDGSPAQKISVLFIDGDHSYEGCKRDIEAWYPHMKEGGVMLFHDCDETSPGVVQAVAEAYQKYGKDWKLFKRTDKNTSMALIRL